MKEYKILVEFRSAYLKKESLSKKKIDIYSLLEWGLDWWKQKGFEILEDNLFGLLSAYRNIYFYEKMVMRDIKKAWGVGSGRGALCPPSECPRPILD